MQNGVSKFPVIRGLLIFGASVGTFYAIGMLYPKLPEVAVENEKTKEENEIDQQIKELEQLVQIQDNTKVQKENQSFYQIPNSSKVAIFDENGRIKRRLWK